MSEEQNAYHALANITHADYQALSRLSERYDTWRNALAAARRDPTIAGAATDETPPMGSDMRLILRTDDDFPASLREIPYPPHGIYIRGSLPQNGRRVVAVVGTRKATPGGKDTARTFARELAQAGCAVLSGLALGIDAAAHEGSLEGKGYTAAVLATGLDRIYPQWNVKLALRILTNGGALISEYPPGSPALPYRFLERNRIVSGLAEGVLIIEAPERSGSLATARFALEQNRQVFVLPGPATHPNFVGSHALIRAGAELVTEPAHVLEALGITSAPASAGMFAEPHSDEERLICDALRNAGGPLIIDNIIEYTKLSAQIVSQTLSFLIIQGTIAENGNGYTMKRP